MQTYKKLQIILVDDGSTDDSLGIMKRYEAVDSRIIIISGGVKTKELAMQGIEV